MQIIGQRPNGWQVVLVSNGWKGSQYVVMKWSVDLPSPQYPAHVATLRCAHDTLTRAEGIRVAVDAEGYLRSFLTHKGRKVPNRHFESVTFCSHCEKVVAA